MNPTDQQTLAECHAAVARIQRQIAALIAVHLAEECHVARYKREILQRPAEAPRLNPT